MNRGIWVAQTAALDKIKQKFDNLSNKTLKRLFKYLSFQLPELNNKNRNRAYSGKSEKAKKKTIR